MELILSDNSGWKRKNVKEEEIRSEFTEKGLMVLFFILLDEERNSRPACLRFIFNFTKHEIRLKYVYNPVTSSTYGSLASLSKSYTSRGSNKALRAHFFNCEYGIYLKMKHLFLIRSDLRKLCP